MLTKGRTIYLKNEDVTTSEEERRRRAQDQLVKIKKKC